MTPFLRTPSQSAHKLPPEQSELTHLLDLKVIPNAKRSQIVGLLGQRLKVKVSAPPEAGKANQAVSKLLAQTLRIRTSQITLTAGHSAPEKTFRIEGLTSTQILDRLMRK